ncbi:putative outer membrane protein [Erythrobacter sp. NAP1]|uniref:SIMPL domain-containing protein n=1 Tax=Erythrobacter sp. NAP1 TaxID=237727 RepID=UPI0000686946|nr:SIMPL domain-containing protein [Erythrobacter sp. NAP1]EAQ29626.1 putative outer membrane protein [Erythrobacter sp. NAP1]
MTRIPLTLAAAGALALPATLAAQQVEIEADGPVIELSVYESITAEPDLVTIGAGVSTEARTAVEAMRMNAEQMNRVIERIIELGVPEEDIQTTGVNLNPRYDYNRETQTNVFRGYQVSNRVSVKLREVDETGAVLDALVVAGATDLSGPDFSIEDDEAAKDAARASAVKRAQSRAESYASMLGFDGVEVLSISEAIQGRAPMPQMAMREVASDSIQVTGSRIQPGMVNTGVNITIKYQMVDDDAETAEAEQ